MNAYGNVYGNQQAPRRRGISLRWVIPLLFALYMAYNWFSTSEVDPYTGEKAHFGASPEEEVQLGTQAYAQVIGDAQQQGALVPANAQVAQQIQEISRRLIERVPNVAADLAAMNNQPVPESYKNFQWQVSVIQSEQENAFCMPGGKIAVFTGLLPVAQNPDAMAVIIGHEIAHALLRHSSQRMAQDKLMQMGQLATGVAMSGMDPGSQRAIMGALGAGAQYGLILPYGRSHETQADQVGLMLAAAACYNPAEAMPLWQRMSQIGGGERPPEFASTHPDPANRIQNLQNLQPQAQQFYAKYCGKAAPGAGQSY